MKADEHLIEIRSGPFQVFSATGEKTAREQMNELEQFRHALAVTLGQNDLKLIWPVQVLIPKNAKQAYASGFVLARDSYVLTAPGSHLDQLARMLIDQNTSRLPRDIEDGLVAVFSTLQINGTHITVGAPPAQRTRNWARMHLLVCAPDYAGRTRVMISNLEHGSDLSTAYRNAFQKSAVQIEKEVDADLASTAPVTNTISGLALNPNRDFNIRHADSDSASLLEADLLFAGESAEAESAYNVLHGPGAAEGLGLVALKANKKDEAKRLFASAIASGSKNARVYVEAAALELEPAKARIDLQKAIELNSQWAVPDYRLALLETDLDRKSEFLKKATSLDARNVEYWEALAKNETEAARFIEAQKAWGGAEQAAATDQEREQIRQVRLNLEGERAEHEAAERKRKADEEARDLQRVKDASMAAIHEAEMAAKKKLNPNGEAPPRPTEWWSGPDAGGKAEGTLQRLDCMGSAGRLVIQTGDEKTIQVLVGDPNKIAVPGSTATLSCGVQNPARNITVLYNPKPNKKLGTVGEAVSIEFH